MNVGNVKRSIDQTKSFQNDQPIKNDTFNQFCCFTLGTTPSTSSTTVPATSTFISINDNLKYNRNIVHHHHRHQHHHHHHHNLKNNDGALGARTGTVVASSTATANTTTNIAKNNSHHPQTSTSIATLNQHNDCDRVDVVVGDGGGGDLLIVPIIYYMLIVILMFCLYFCIDLQPTRVLALEQFVSKLTNHSATRTSMSEGVSTLKTKLFRYNPLTTTTNNDNNNNTMFNDSNIPLNRQTRSTPKSVAQKYTSNIDGDNILDQPFTILALLPDENAPLISRALRDGQSKWEMSGQSSEYYDQFLNGNQSNNSGSKGSESVSKMLQKLRASDIQLTIYSEPTNNDTERILSSTCEWIKVHKPSLVLSLLDHKRAFYAAMVAESAQIPFVSITQHYQKDIDQHQIVGAKTTSNSQSASSSSSASDGNKSNQRENNYHNDYWQASANRLSLDPPIQTLADATFKLLRAQYWFDALLIIDESIVSDVFARRLHSLCDSFRRKLEKKHGVGRSGTSSSSSSSSFTYYGDGRYKRHFNEPKQQSPQSGKATNKMQSDPTTTTTTKSKAETMAKTATTATSTTESLDTQYDTFTWMNLKRSSVKKSTLLADTLLLPKTEQQQHHQKQQEPFGGQSIFEQQQQQQQRQQGQMHQQQHYSKAALLMSIWKKLMVIRVSQSLDQKEFYLRMAEIQNTHRRVVLVHCDKITIKRVLKTANELDLFNGEKIWILLDGMLGPDEKFDMTTTVMDHQKQHNPDDINGGGGSATDSIEYHLPNGILAIQNRHRLIYDPELLDSVVELMGKAALNSYQKHLIKKWQPSWWPAPDTRSNMIANPQPSSRTPFYYSNRILNNKPSAFVSFKNVENNSNNNDSSNSNSNSNDDNLINNYDKNQTTTSGKSASASVFTYSSTSSKSSSSLTSSTLPMKSFNHQFPSTASMFNSNNNNNNGADPNSGGASGGVNSGGCLSKIHDDNVGVQFVQTKQIEYRSDILRELRKLLNPILAKYRRIRSRCSQRWPTNTNYRNKNPNRTTSSTSSSASFSSRSSSSSSVSPGNRNQNQKQSWPESDGIFASSASIWQHPEAGSSLDSQPTPIMLDQAVNDAQNGPTIIKDDVRNDRTKSLKQELIGRRRLHPERRHVYGYGDDSPDNNDDYDEYDADFMASSNVPTTNKYEDGDDHDPNNYDDDDDDLDLDDDLFQQEMYRSIVPHFDILNLVPTIDSWNNIFDNDFVKSAPIKREWRLVGNITNDQTIVNTIMYIGADKWPNYLIYAAAEQQSFGGQIDSLGYPDLLSSGPSRPIMATNYGGSGKHRFRVVTNIAPPFVIESTKLNNNTCLIGVFCLKVQTNVRDDLIAIFTDFRSQRRRMENRTYNVHCCAGIAIDLLNAVGRDLHFDYDLYLVADGLFGIKKDGKWDGVTADLVNDVAHLSFTAFSTTSSRVQAIDYSVPFFYSGVSCLSSVSSYSDVRLLAFLIPFSYELWAAIFASLVATAIAAAIYEWFSPFGLNPWGRQRTKNFSLASALWVMCSLLFSHLVAFKAPKSWPNKVLINVWGAFSVIFLATYTANIAAHFAGFLLPEVNDFHDSSLMQQRTGTARSSASEGYLMEKYTELWHHIQRYKVDSFDAGLENLRNGKLDVLIGDTAILDYYRANDPGCNLRLLGDSIFDDAYAVGMQKGFPFRESISNLILTYNEYGFLDQLHRKWYGRVHCLESTSLSKPEPLTVRGVAGVFLMLTIGILVGVLILLAEHFTFKYWLPKLRKKPKDCFWKSPNLMFFSQKLYRFINTVELVSPHHSAKEIITNLREGQIASLFQKSVKRKAKEEARRRKSKSQFFEMIQEVRKVVHLQQTERSMQIDDDDDVDEVGVTINDEDDLESDIDEEVALNTNANIRATRPSFSMSQDELIEMEIRQNRVSAIRFREPNDNNSHNDGSNVHHYPPNPSDLVHRKLASSLKSSTESSLGSFQARKYNSSTDSQDNVVAVIQDDSRRSTRRHRRKSSGSGTILKHHHQHPAGKQQSREAKPVETARSRRKKLLQTHLSSTSFSLENIFFEGILSEGLSDQDEKKRNRIKRRTLSFEDLPAIKKELSESSQEDHGGNLIESEQYRRYTTKTSIVSAKSRSEEKRRYKSKMIRHQTSMTESPTARYAKLSRHEILNLWDSSENQLLTRLQNTMQQKRALEEKVALLERMLRKPP